MTARILWSTVQQWTVPMPIPGPTYITQTFVLNVPAFSPSGASPFLWLAGESVSTFNASTSWLWTPTSTGVAAGVYRIPFYFTPDDYAGGQLSIQLNFFSLNWQSNSSSPPATVPAWAVDIQTNPYVTLIAYIWDPATTLFGSSAALGSGPEVQGIVPLTIYNNPTNYFVQLNQASPTSTEWLAYSFPAFGFYPGIDDAWAVAQGEYTGSSSFTQPRGFSSLDINGTELYSVRNRYDANGPDGGSPSIVNTPPSVVSLNDSIQLPINQNTPTWQWVSANYRLVQGAGTPLVYDIDSWVFFPHSGAPGTTFVNYNANFTLQWYTYAYVYNSGLGQYVFTPTAVGTPIQWVITIPPPPYPAPDQTRRVTLTGLTAPIDPSSGFTYTNLAYQVIGLADTNGLRPSNYHYSCIDFYNVAVYTYAGGDTHYLTDLSPGVTLQIQAQDITNTSGNYQFWFTPQVASVTDDTHAALSMPNPTGAILGNFGYTPQVYSVTWPTGTQDVLIPPATVPLPATHVRLQYSTSGAGTFGYTIGLRWYDVNHVAGGFLNSGTHITDFGVSPAQILVSTATGSFTGNDTGVVDQFFQLNSSVRYLTPYVNTPLYFSGVVISVTLTFYNMQQFVTINKAMPSYVQRPTIASAAGSMPNWRDNYSVVEAQPLPTVTDPLNSDVDASYVGAGILGALGDSLAVSNYPTPLDIAQTIAVDFGPTQGDVQRPVPNSVSMYGFQFRTPPQNQTCRFLGRNTLCTGLVQQGSSIFTTTLTPIAVPSAYTVSKVAGIDDGTGPGSALVLMTDGSVWLAGLPQSSRLGFFERPSVYDYTCNGMPQPLTTALDGTPLPPMVDIAVGNDRFGGITWLMLDQLGNLWGFGNNACGQLGVGASSIEENGTTFHPEFQIMRPVVIANGVTAFAAGANKSMMVSGGQLYVSGRMTSGESNQIGGTLGLPYDPSPRIYASWTAVPGMTGVRQISDLGSASNDCNYACLMADGSVKGWTADAYRGGLIGATNFALYPRGGTTPIYSGSNGSWVTIPELGTGNRAIQAAPAGFGSPAKALYTLTTNGQILITGGVDSQGSAGDGVTITASDTHAQPPFQVLMPFGVNAVAMADSRTGMLFVGTDGEVYAWGGNSLGMIGNGTADTTPHPIPTPIAALSPLSLTPPVPPVGGILRTQNTVLFFQGIAPKAIPGAAPLIMG